MFSGSFPDDIQTAAQDYMHDYAFLTVGRFDPSMLGIVQKVYNVDRFGKREKLMELILDPARDPRERLLIFTQAGVLVFFGIVTFIYCIRPRNVQTQRLFICLMMVFLQPASMEA